jgi:hypothetical protein
MKHKDTTIVIQGPVINTTIFALAHYSELANIVFSFECNNDYPSFLKHYESEEIKIKTYSHREIENYMNDNRICYKNYSHNFIRQSYSSKLGTELVNTKYCIKTRSDEFYENIEYFIDQIKSDEESVFTSNIFYRKFEFMPYHPSDHIIGSTTTNMVNGYKVLWNLIQNKTIKSEKHNIHFDCVCPEQYFCLAFMYYLAEKNNSYVNEETFKQYFKKINIEKLGNYRATCNHRGQVFFNNYHLFHDCNTNNCE